MSRMTGEYHAGCSKGSPSKAAGESKPEAYPLGYVEDFDKLRTKLANFFSILLGLHQHLHELLRFGSSPVTRTEDLVADHPLSIDHERHRETPCAIGQSYTIVSIV